MDRITYDVREAERLGYGVHYGHYKADHPVSDYDQDVEERQKHLPPRKCKECEKEFIPGRPNMWYCSEECRNRRGSRMSYQRKNNRKKYPKGPAECMVCGSDFYRKYVYTETCSRQCAAILRESRIREKITGAEV